MSTLESPAAKPTLEHVEAYLATLFTPDEAPIPNSTWVFLFKEDAELYYSQAFLDKKNQSSLAPDIDPSHTPRTHGYHLTFIYCVFAGEEAAIAALYTDGMVSLSGLHHVMAAQETSEST